MIRAERAGDEGAIARATAAAFAGAAHGSGREADIVEGLRRDDALALSLVAECDGAIVGHVAFSPVLIDGRDHGWVGLGPLSVAPAGQGRGVGTALVREGLAKLTAAGCTVLGEPGFYARCGFEPRAQLIYPGFPATYFQAIRLSGDWPAGVVRYHPAFDG